MIERARREFWHFVQAGEFLGASETRKGQRKERTFRTASDAHIQGAVTNHVGGYAYRTETGRAAAANRKRQALRVSSDRHFVRKGIDVTPDRDKGIDATRPALKENRLLFRDVFSTTQRSAKNHPGAAGISPIRIEARIFECYLRAGNR